MQKHKPIYVFKGREEPAKKVLPRKRGSSKMSTHSCVRECEVCGEERTCSLEPDKWLLKTYGINTVKRLRWQCKECKNALS